MGQKKCGKGHTHPNAAFNRFEQSGRFFYGIICFNRRPASRSAVFSYPFGGEQVTATSQSAARQLHLHGRFCDEQLQAERVEQEEVFALSGGTQKGAWSRTEADKVYKGAGEKSTVQRDE